MSKKADTSTFSIPVFESNAEFRVNTAHFSEEDLALFIESMETIWRLRRERHELRRQRREIIRATKQMPDTETSPPTTTTPIPSSPVPPAEELLDEQEIVLETKSVSPAPSSVRKASDDENYYSDAGQSQSSSPRSSRSDNSNSKKHHLSPSASETSRRTILTGSAASDSEESGVFPVSADSPPPPKERSTKTRSRSNMRAARSKIVALIMKREHIEAESNTNIISDPSHKKSKSSHHLNHNDPTGQDSREQYKRFSLRYLRRKLKANFSRHTMKIRKAELEGLDNKLRYMTL